MANLSWVEYTHTHTLTRTPFFTDVETIFAYRQISSGKTHTMIGDMEYVGIILQAIGGILDYIYRRHQETWPMPQGCRHRGTAPHSIGDEACLHVKPQLHVVAGRLVISGGRSSVGSRERGSEELDVPSLSGYHWLHLP